MNELLIKAIEAAFKSGKEILQIYNTDFEVEQKADKSPLTKADKKAHLKIIEILADTNLPFLSEEGKNIDFAERKNWDRFWMIDPLDGTKEFIKRNGEFTVNIALVEYDKPVLGVIYVPVKDEMYFGGTEIGSFKLTTFSESYHNHASLSELVRFSQKLPFAENTEYCKVVASRSHLSKETEEFIDLQQVEYANVETISVGSSLKFCLVAEGLANVYPRFAPTMEWDTAAGQAIAESAGCSVFQNESSVSLKYNKENLLNPWFIVRR